MMRLKFFIVIIGILLLFSCRENSPNVPPNENSHPQVDIPWSSLANSPCPCIIMICDRLGEVLMLDHKKDLLHRSSMWEHQ